MRVGVIYRKELRTCFATPLGYIFIAMVALIGGLYSFTYNFFYGYATFETAVAYVPFFFVFFIPLLTAGIFTEERRKNTAQLLYTLPLTTVQVVLGKYFALLTIIAIPLGLLGLYPLLMSLCGTVNFSSAYGNLFALFLLGACLAAICMFISALSKHIVVSALVSFGLLLVLYQMDTLLEGLLTSAKVSYIGFVVIAVLVFVVLLFVTKNIYVAAIPAFALLIVVNLLYWLRMTTLAGKINLLLQGLAVFSRFVPFSQGIFDLTAVFYFVTASVLFVVFTVLAFDRKR